MSMIPVSRKDAFDEACRIIGEQTVLTRLQAQQHAEELAAANQQQAEEPAPISEDETAEAPVVDLRDNTQ